MSVLADSGTPTNPGVPSAVDIALDGRGYVVDTTREAGFRVSTVPTRRPQQDTSDSQGGGTLTKEGLWSRTVEGFRGGAGQFFSRADVTDRLRLIEGFHVSPSERLIARPKLTNDVSVIDSPVWAVAHPPGGVKGGMVPMVTVPNTGKTLNGEPYWNVFVATEDGVYYYEISPSNSFGTTPTKMSGLTGSIDAMCAMGGYIFALKNSVIYRAGYIGIPTAFDAGQTIQEPDSTAWPGADTCQMFGAAGKVFITSPHSTIPVLYTYDWENHTAGGTDQVTEIITFRSNDDIIGVVDTGSSVFVGVDRIEGTAEIFRLAINPSSGAVSVDERAFVFPAGELLTGLAATDVGVLAGFRTGFRFLAEDGSGNLTAGARVEMGHVTDFAVAGPRVAFVESTIQAGSPSNSGWVGWIDLNRVDDALVPAWWFAHDATAMLGDSLQGVLINNSFLFGVAVFPAHEHDTDDDPQVYVLSASAVNDGVVYALPTSSFSRDSTLWTPWYDFGVQTNKVLHSVRVRCEAAAVNNTIDVYYATDLEDSWTQIGSGQTLTGGGGYTVLDFQLPDGVDFNDVSVRVDVSGTSQSDDVAILGVDIFANPEPERVIEMVLPIRLYGETARPGANGKLHYDVQAELDVLLGFAASADSVHLDWAQESYDILVEDVEFFPEERASTAGWQGIARLRCKRFLAAA